MAIFDSFLPRINRIRTFWITTLMLFGFTSLSVAQTGRVAGTVTAADDGEPLPGAHVMIVEEDAGAAADPDGNYSIVNVPPGTYTIEATAVGFASTTIEDVRVNIDQTTNVDIEMREEEFVGEEVVLVDERPVVEEDVSASRANISSADMESLPVVDVSDAIGLQAGIQGLDVRGLGSQYMQFQVGGFSMRDERDNTPYTAISMTSVAEMQVQTGGFNAEYGNVQSGVVNVVTRSGDRDRYNADVIFRYSPPGKKHFGPSPNDPESFFMRPYLDDDVAWDGTDNGAWDRYTQRQYPEFEGWRNVEQSNLSPGSEYYGLSATAAQRLFEHEHRKDFAISEPDYDLDLGFGGPVPYVGEFLGNLRFWASHRRTQEMYLYPLSEDRYQDHSTHIKLTSDVIEGAGMTLDIEALFGSQSGTNNNNVGQPGIFRGSGGIAGAPNQHSYQRSVVFSSDYFAPTEVDRFMIGANFTRMVTDDTFYDISLSHFQSDYDTNPNPLRSDETVAVFGNDYEADEAPFGFQPEPSSGIGTGMRMGVGMSNSRDSSRVSYQTAEFDLTSQLTHFMQIKTGAEFVRTHSKVNYAAVDEFLQAGRTASRWDKKPLRGGLYAQTTLEFEGMVANIGLRADYHYANTTWYDFDPFDPALGPGNIDMMDDLLETTDTDHQVFLSPRLGVSFPITVESKLFFNYGHFRSMPQPENLYMIRRETLEDRVARIANPNMPLPQTVAYELGYEHSLMDQYLIRITGYYSDMRNHTELVDYVSADDRISYSISEPNWYRDHRGFEVTLERGEGRFFTGFVNYTYMVTSQGRFGFPWQYENPAEQRQQERQYEPAETRPVARPYARVNLDFHTPADFGPEWGGFNPLERWNINLLANWQAGRWLTWTGPGAAPPGVSNNIQWRDEFNIDMRISRDFEMQGTRIRLFADISNVLNTKRMSQWASYGFEDGDDYNRYMQSLHLPAGHEDEMMYEYVPGDDQPGDFRELDKDFVPIEARSTVSSDEVSSPNERALYYDTGTDEYFQWSDQEGDFIPADEDHVDHVLDNNKYIEMPNHQSFTFLNPRNVFFGIRVQF